MCLGGGFVCVFCFFLVFECNILVLMVLCRGGRMEFKLEVY